MPLQPDPHHPVFFLLPPQKQITLTQVLGESTASRQLHASPPLRVVPLFETLSDLDASRSIMQRLLR
jgi:hypothetical protein